MQISGIELFGYLGSFLVLISFLMTSVYKLRIVNTIGSVIFAAYAMIIHSYPTALMNVCLVIINLRFLWKMAHTRRDYEIVDVNRDDLYLQHFLKTYDADIRKCFPGLEPDVSGADVLCFINCDGKPAGIFAGKRRGERVDILLDYAVPELRDFSIGAYLQEQLPAKGVLELVYKGPTEHHTEYLKRMGFQKGEDGYVRYL